MAEQKQKTQEEIAAEEGALLAQLEAEEAAKKQAAEEAAKKEAAKQSNTRSKSKTVKVINNSKAIQYLGETKILPDNKGVEMDSAEFELFLKNPGVKSLVDKKLLEVR